jgi:5-methylthioadenosine/S-adenosylhomocysteine deaminase
MQQVDTLVHADWVIPVEPEGLVLEAHSVAIHDGLIHSLLPRAEAETLPAGEVVELPGHALIPGLVNAHTHAAMSLLRGLADDLPLMTWLREHIWPTEARWVDPQFVADGTRLAIAEMIRSGTTCFSDMYFFPEITAAEVRRCGLRATVGLILIDFPSAWARSTDEYLSKGLALRAELAGEPRLRTALAPHAPYTVSDASLAKLAVFAADFDLPVHMHLHETPDEVDNAVQSTGERPLGRLQRLGLLNSRLVAVHMTQLQEDEIGMLAGVGAKVAHCPQSNLKLASGFAPLAALDRAGVCCAIGTDGAASNNTLDMLAELRTAALLAKAVAADAAAIPAARALTMATLGGARAFGWEHQIGSLKVGKQADMVAMDLTALECAPLHNPLSQIVYAAGREQVSDCWVAGRRLLAKRKLLTIDEHAVRAQAEEWRLRLSAGHGSEQPQ